MSNFVEKASKLVQGCGRIYREKNQSFICAPNKEDLFNLICFECRRAQATALDFLQDFKEEFYKNHTCAEKDCIRFAPLIEDITRAIEILENHSPREVGAKAQDVGNDSETLESEDTHCPNCNNRDLTDTNLKCPHCGNHSPKDSARRSGARETGYKESKDNPQTKPEPSAEGASNAMDEKERSFTRDKPADTHSPRNMKETADGFAPYEALKSGSEMSLSSDSGDYQHPQTSSAGESGVSPGVSPGTQGQPYPTPQASPADREEVKE